MNKEQKDKLEQAAKAYIDSWPFKSTALESSAFLAGAQTVLDNYHDYGLQSIEKYKDMVSANVRLGAENQRLRETLEQVIDFIECDKKFNALSTAKEALKQQDDD